MKNILRQRRSDDAAPGPATVSETVAHLRHAVEAAAPHVHVVGEISGWSPASSGHCYFTLKDEEAALSCVMWASSAARLRFRPQDGALVELRGRATIFSKRGTLQLVADRLEPAGEGELHRRFLELKARLEAEGLFDPAKKRPLPLLPRAVGVVTSPTGAVIQDIATIMRRRAPWVPVLLAPARVQGEGAAAEIIAGLRRLAAGGRVDVVIVARGGGSLEDLWCFNDEALARALRACPVPVVSAVGHETDFTICDFAADLRAPTPSAAAELVSAGHEALAGRIGDLVARLDDALEQPLRELRRRIEGALRSWGMRAPEMRLRELQQRADEAQRRLPLAVQQRLERVRHRVARAEAALGGHDPELVLRKGYAIVRRRGHVLTRAADVAANDLLRIEFHDGTAEARALRDAQKDLFDDA